MSIAKIILITFIGAGSLVFGAEELPKMPFKKSLTLTSVLLYQKAYQDEELVSKLSDKMANYAVLESKAETVVRPLMETRKSFKKLVKNTTFKNSEDLKQVFEEIKKETEEMVAHNIEELQRDHLICYDAKAPSVFGSETFKAMLAAAKEYQAQQFGLRKHPLYEQLEQAREDLRPLMYEFLKRNYANVDELQKSFNNSIQSVNIYLDALRLRGCHQFLAP